MNRIIKSQSWPSLSILISIILLAGSCKPLPADDETVEPMTFDGLMGQQYTEILPVYGNVITKKLTAGVYNTLGLNDPDSTGNTSTDEMLAKMDMDKVKKESNALKVLKNGPRLWTIDWIEVNAGNIREFEGLEARWVMWFFVPKGFKQGESAYSPMQGKRDTHMGIMAGSRAFILDDPDGTTWVMKSADRIFHPEQTYEDLKNLGAKLSLPEGWSFRTIILEEELIFKPDNGSAWICQDDMGNTYDRVGGNFSNYKP